MSHASNSLRSSFGSVSRSDFFLAATNAKAVIVFDAVASEGMK
jgi:hypothetical protein